MKKNAKNKLIKLGVIDSNPCISVIGNNIPINSMVMLDLDNNEVITGILKEKQEYMQFDIVMINLPLWNDETKLPTDGLAIEMGYGKTIYFGYGEQL